MHQFNIWVLLLHQILFLNFYAIITGIFSVVKTFKFLRVRSVVGYYYVSPNLIHQNMKFTKITWLRHDHFRSRRKFLSQKTATTERFQCETAKFCKCIDNFVAVSNPGLYSIFCITSLIMFVADNCPSSTISDMLIDSSLAKNVKILSYRVWSSVADSCTLDMLFSYLI